MKVMVKIMFVMVTLSSGLTLSDSLREVLSSTTGLDQSASHHHHLLPLQQQEASRHHTSPPHPHPGHHHHRRQAREVTNTQQVIDTTELYAFCLNLSARFQSHVRRDPHDMSLSQFQGHLWTLFKELDFLAFVSQFVGSHVGVVSTAHDARVLYNLLDLYSALEELRQRYLQKVMERFLVLANQEPGVPGRLFTPVVHMIPGLARHIRAIRRNMTALYRSALEPRANNVEFVARYQAGAMAKLDRMMANLSFPSPFLAMEEGRGYVLRPADHPGFQLTVQGSHGSWNLVASNTTSWNLVASNTTSWNLMATNTTDAPPPPSSVFSFKPVRGAYGAVQYVLTCASLPAIYHLIIPHRDHAARRKKNLYFGTQEGGALDLMKLPGGEHVLVHKIKKVRDQVLYLYWVAQDAQVGFTSSYPGREAHWLLQDTTRGVPQDLKDDHLT